MNYAVIKKNDIANGPGVRVSLFVSGCRHKCPGCFNSEAWDFNYGTAFKEDTVREIIDALRPSYITGLSLLGGEPFEPENAGGLAALTAEVRNTLADKTIWCYTGFTFEDIVGGALGEDAVSLLENLDVVVDGKFVQKLKDAALLFRGSSNQRIIDVRRSLECGETVLLDGVWERKMGSGDIYEN